MFPPALQLLTFHWFSFNLFAWLVKVFVKLEISPSDIQSPPVCKGNLSLAISDISKMASVKQSEEAMEQVNGSIEFKAQVNGDNFALSLEHEQYLLQRHGTLDLDPVPQPDDADPYNWPQPKASSIPKPYPFVLPE